MKYIITFPLLLLALLIPATALAHDFEVDGIYYNINGTTATVTVTHGNNEYSGTVIIPSTVTYGGLTYAVTAIGKWAFSRCSSLTTINIPNSVTSIGEWAFEECTNLTNINIPNSVTSIGDQAFEGTGWYANQPDGLIYAGLVAYEYKGNMPEGTSITIKDGTTAIAGFAFNWREGLISINIPNSVTSIGEWAFCGCSNLTDINIPNSVISIGSEAFEATPWLDIQPDGLVYAGLVAYQYKGTMPEETCITLKEGTKGIADAAFSGCSGLADINIPDSVQSIGSRAFKNCTNLKSITIGKSVMHIGTEAFFYSGLETVNFNAISCSDFEWNIFSCEGESKISTINIGDSVQVIPGNFAVLLPFLKNINIPNSVTTIGTWAFIACNSLTNVTIGNSVKTIGEEAFWGCSTNNVYCYATIPPECIIRNGNSTFSNYSGTLHVPAATLSAYFTAPIWGNFENIVGDAIAPTDIAISKDSVELPLNEQIELTATVIPANASFKEVTWYSTDPSVATVENGIVTAVHYGECDIIAFCFGMKAVCHVSVTNRISLEQQETMLLPNHMLVLNPIAPVMPSGFTVTSSDPTVAAARVMNGKVQIVGIKEGTTMITVASSDGTAQPATCLVTVYTESGDVDMDGFVNISDVTSLIDYLLGNVTTGFKEGNADLDRDGNVNIADVTALIDQLLSSGE